MLRKVKIKAVPKARTGYQVQGSLANDVPAWGGADYNAYIGMPNAKVNKTLTAVPREAANLEAEGGETVVGNIDGSMMPSFYTIEGPRHSNGGVPLNLPDDSFIFSDTKSMKITDPALLKMFNLAQKKGGYTPAEMSKKFDINNYRKILQDPNTDKIARKTAEMMIKNYTMKLGALALAQESKKGFPQGVPLIAQPYMEANGIKEEDIMPTRIPEEAELQASGMPMQEQGMEMEQPGMESEAPETMPNGEPIAMPQEMEQMSPEMMQEAPMAMYGMQMGGYDFPYYNAANEMAYGGTPKSVKKYQNGGKTESNLTEEDLKTIKEKWNGNKKAYIDFMNTKAGITSNTKLLDAMYAQYQKDIANKANYTQGKQNEQLYKGYQPELAKLTKDQMVNELLAQEERNARLAAFGFDPAKTDQRISQKNKDSRTNQQALDLISKTPGLQDLDFKGGYKGQAAYIAYRNALNQPDFKQHGQFQVGVGDETVGGVRGAITGIDNANTNTTLGQRLNYVASPDIIPPSTSKKKKCECTDPETGEKTTFEISNDEECICEDTEIVTQQDDIVAPPRREPEWWLQDTINTMGAFGNVADLKKQMPWEARADLEEPRGVFYSPERELTAQNEQANIIMQGLGQFAGPQAASARASSVQGQAAKQAADTLSRYNNMNVGLANQLEQQQVGIRNQERLMNQQMATRVYDKNTIAQQQFDNAKRQTMADLRTAYNTALTNRAKTDALNQLYPNYQVDPSSGGMVTYTPTEKEADPGVEEQTAIEYVNSISHLPPKMQELLFKQKFGRMGGQMKKGGSLPFTYMFY